MTPRRIQRRRTKGWRMPDGAVYVGRPTRWGNPFKPGELVTDPGPWKGPACHASGVLAPGTYTARDITGHPYSYEVRPVMDRADAVALFRAHVAFHDDTWDPAVIRQALGGRDLACWCPETMPCHADVLLEIANRPAGDTGTGDPTC